MSQSCLLKHASSSCHKSTDYVVNIRSCVTHFCAFLRRHPTVAGCIFFVSQQPVWSSLHVEDHHSWQEVGLRLPHREKNSFHSREVHSLQNWRRRVRSRAPAPCILFCWTFTWFSPGIYSSSVTNIAKALSSGISLHIKTTSMGIVTKHTVFKNICIFTVSLLYSVQLY